MINTQWKPDPKQCEDLYNLFEKKYLGRKKTGKIPDGYAPFLQNCAKIAVFLSDKDAVIRQLKKLNALLNDENEKQKLASDTNEPNSKIKYKKVLRSVLERELSKMNFQPKLAKAIGLLSPSAFRACIREGLLIKDPGVVEDHGEFSHPIQWLLIGWQQQETDFLSSSVIEIFIQLGRNESVYSNLDGELESNLWDELVDQMLEFKSDCRAPGYLHILIEYNQDPDLLLLKTIIAARSAKRKMQENQRSLFFMEPNSLKKNYEISKIDSHLWVPKSSP